jgi:ribosome modulation factor
VRAEPFGSLEQAESWLDSVRGDRDRTAEELERAGRLLNRVLHAHRVAAADPYARDVSPGATLVTRTIWSAGWPGR